jgi:hypothetical protein
MKRQFFVKDYAPPKVTEEERKESRRQEGLLGVKLNDKKFYCEKKLTDTCQHFFHGRGKFGRCGVEDDGRRFIQIYTIDLDVKSQLAAKSSDGAFHKFLQACYDKICEIYEKRLATSKAAREADQNNSKNCQTEKEKMQKDQACRSADRILQEQQKVKKTQPPFDKENFKTWAGFDQENAERSKSNLTEKKTACLTKIKECEKSISSREVERKPFDGKISELQVKLDTDLSEGQFKDIKLSLEYQELNIKKIEAKIEKSENEKSKVETELEQLERQIQVLNCVLDHQNLLHEVKNFHDRKTRVVERMRKILQDRDALNATRENLNKLWHELTKPKESEKKRVSVFGQDAPTKPEKIADELCLKADAENYFI